MYQEGIEKRGQEIALIYKIIHKVVIRYGIFFLIIVGAIYRVQIITTKETNIISLTDNTAAQKELQIRTFKKEIDTIQGTGKMAIFVGLGTLEKSGTLLSSYNNLLSYNGYTVPRYFEGDTSLFETSKLLEGEIDSKEDLGVFINNLLSIKNRDRIVKKEHRPLEIKENVVSTFNLQCLSQSKIYNGLCEIFTDNFVETFILYDIQADLEGFREIFTILTNQDKAKYQNKICKNLVYYSYYSENTSNELKNIMKLCPVTDYDTFNKFALYYEIQKELENKIISNTVYTDNTINEYKIRSFMQILYEDINGKRINIDRINNYLDFIEQLLKQEKLSILDTNLVYYFNNYYLNIQIQNPELFMKVDNKSDLNKLLKRISNINNGNLLIGYKGLTYNVNENVMIKESEVENGIIEQNYNNVIEKLLDQIKNFDIDTKQISGNQVLTKGTLHLTTATSEIIDLNIKARFQEQSSILFIKKIDITGEVEFSENINSIISKEQRSFGDLQRYLSENRNLLTTKEIATEKPGKDALQTLCEGAKNALVNLAFLERCNETTIGASFKQNDKNIGISLNYENFVFKNIDVSDTETKKQISDYLNRPEIITKYRTIDQSNMVSFLVELIKLIKNNELDPTIKQDFTASENTLIVIEDIKKYLGVTVNDIVEKNSTTTVITFNLGKLSLMGNYSITNHTIEQLYFAKIMTNDRPTLISNIKIKLDDSNIEEIKKFRKDPIEYIKNNSVESYLFYMQNTK